MAELIQKDGLKAILEFLPFRSDIHPRRQLKALQALRDRMREHIDQDALDVLGAAIAKLEGSLKDEAL